MKKTVIIIHEIYGVTENFILLKEKLESRGFSVILPSLYEDNYCGIDGDEAYKKFFTEVGIEKGSRIIGRLVEQINGSEIFLLGFSVGATIAWLHSTDKRIKSVIGIYGSRIREYSDITPETDTYLFFCDEESFDINPVISQIERKNHVKVSILKGRHGFYNLQDAESKELIKKVNEEIIRILEM